MILIKKTRYSISLCILMLILCYNHIYGQETTIFKNFTAKLNNEKIFVKKTAQDHSGLIWMISSQGVVKFNGHSYRFVNKKEIFKNITDNDVINDIIADDFKNLWITTLKGLLVKYNSSEGIYENIANLLIEPTNFVYSKNKSIWIVSKTGKLFKFENKLPKLITIIPKINGLSSTVTSIDVNKNNMFIGTSTGKIYNYSIIKKTINEITETNINYQNPIHLKIDNNNKLWITTERSGILIYCIEKKKFIQNDFLDQKKYSFDKALFSDIYFDSKCNIWGITDGNGLYKINSITGKVNHFKKGVNPKFSLSSNTLIHINEDNNKNLWLVNKNRDLITIPYKDDKIGYHKGSGDYPESILSIFKGKNNDLWLGTDGNGLTKIEHKSNKIKHFFKNDNKLYVQTIIEDDSSNIWLGSYKKGLWIYDKKRKKFKNKTIINKKKQIASDVRILFKDSKNRIWVGSNVSIDIYNTNKKLIASFCYGENGLKGTIAESINEDSDKNIWLGIDYGGLHKFNENLNNIQYSSFTVINNPIDKHIPRAISILPSLNNNLWFINGVDKLSLFNSNKGTIKNYDFKNHNKIGLFQALLEESPNKLWISTTKGLISFDTKNDKINTYHTSDGLQSNYFLTRSAYKGSDNIMYFGSKLGVNFFHPKKIKKQKLHPKFIINDIKLLNTKAKNLLPNQVKSYNLNIDTLYLKNEQSSFSIEFSAIENILTPNFSYSYKLKGFDNNWRTSQHEGVATYTNIPPGHYDLEMKAHENNKDSLVTKKNIKIIISPPFYKSKLAYFIYIAIFIIIIFRIYKNILLRRKLFLNKLIRQKDNELHQSKMDFFIDMSHEIQTPLALIITPIEDMLKKANLSGDLLLEERLNIINNNAIKLSRIASKIGLNRDHELNNLTLNVKQNNIHQDIKKIHLSFKELARIKKIDFHLTCPIQIGYGWYDKDKLEHILYNIISNAFKYTSSEGNIDLKIFKQNNNLKIIISDSGIGISKNEIKNIFKKFYRNKNTINIKGSGIGLSLTKELIAIHNGNIEVKSKLGKGTTFTIEIPILKTDYNLDQQTITPSFKTKKLNSNNRENTKKNKKSNQTILIVDDNIEIQSLLKKLLSKQYNIILANNGEEGYNLAKNNTPNLIISDIKMPILDGIEMCKKLNKNLNTQHIPIILLTGKNSMTSKFRGLEAGAIEFIQKPFNTNELLLKVMNIISSNEKLKTSIKTEVLKNPIVENYKTQNDIFLEKLSSIVNKRMIDSSFKVEEITEALNMSYSTLYRKCISTTGINLKEYIKMLRLKKAAYLLINYGYRVSEVTYMVGFNDSKYFSKNFKNYFNVSPSEFHKKYLESKDKKAYLEEYNINISNNNKE